MFVSLLIYCPRPLPFVRCSYRDQIYQCLQFTLNGRVTSKGKVDFAGSMPPSEAREFYERFVKMIGEAHVPELVKDGVFGAKMEVSLVNDGPVTVVLNSSDMKGATA